MFWPAGDDDESSDEEVDFDLDDGEEEGEEDDEEGEEEVSGEEDGEEEGEESDEQAEEAEPKVGSKRKLDNADLIGDRILTDEDFALIRKRRLMQQVQKIRGKDKMKRNIDSVTAREQLCVGLSACVWLQLEDMEEEELEDELDEMGGGAGFSEKVTDMDLMGYHKKKKLDKEERVASIMKGREVRISCAKFAVLSTWSRGVRNSVGRQIKVAALPTRSRIKRRRI